MWYSHPRWIVELLEEALIARGRAADDLEALLEADNAPAKVALVARDISAEQLRERIAAAKMDSSDSFLMDSAVLLDWGDPHRLWAVQDGEAGVQDEGSQLVAALLAHAPIEGTDQLWLDLCAGPGGKTATLAAIAANRGAAIHANEPQSHRLDLVADSVAPWADIVSLREGDGRDLGRTEAERYDRVLVDAPCTGLGALRRRPESRWRKAPEDLAQLVELQKELLAAGFAALRTGGALVYSTCSPVLAETRDIIDAFLAAHPEAELVDAASIAATLAKTDISTTDGTIQLWPDQHHADAMFMALVTKRSQAN